MLILAFAALLAALFATCRWSGATLAHHHGDGREVAAVAALGTAVLGGLWLVKLMHGDSAALPLLGLFGAGAGGLFAGYMRNEVPE